MCSGVLPSIEFKYNYEIDVLFNALRNIKYCNTLFDKEKSDFNKKNNFLSLNFNEFEVSKIKSNTKFEFMAQAGYKAFFDSDKAKGVKFELGDAWVVYTMKDQFGESVKGIGRPEGNLRGQTHGSNFLHRGVKTENYQK